MTDDKKSTTQSRRRRTAKKKKHTRHREVAKGAGKGMMGDDSTPSTTQVDVAEMATSFSNSSGTATPGSLNRPRSAVQVHASGTNADRGSTDDSSKPGEEHTVASPPSRSRRTSARRGRKGERKKSQPVPAEEPTDPSQEHRALQDETSAVETATGNKRGRADQSAARPATKRKPRSESANRRGSSQSSSASAALPKAIKGRKEAAPSKANETAKPSRTAAARSGRKKASEDDRTAREMLINISEGDECRIAVLLGGRLEELFIERASTQSHVGNIYKGRITNIEPSIQAAFIDFSLAQHGFLHISDVQPQYFPDHKGEKETVGRKIPRQSRPRIQDCFRRGQEVIVQVSREGVGTKGPTLTTYLSIAGRFLVMMPGMNRHGVSRKIEDQQSRRTMRDLLKQLDLPPGIGFILRTAGRDRTNRELQQDLNYLMRLWKAVVDRIKQYSAPAELYQESDLVTRTIRDVYTSDFQRVVADDAAAAQRARECLQLAMPRSKPAVELYTDREPLFHRWGIEEEIERINKRQVPLPSGGSLVIDSTEALVAIDVNSGRSRITDDADETAFQINLEAAKEIARQLRLRDLGGLIVCDFIDMKFDHQKRAVERALREALKQHKERARTLRISAFGLLEITRQRQGPSLKRNIYFDCPQCEGTGLVKMPDSVILDVMRIIQLATSHKEVRKVTVTVARNIAFQILNSKRAVLHQIETETGKKVIVEGSSALGSGQLQYVCEDSRGQPVNMAASHTKSRHPRNVITRRSPA